MNAVVKADAIKAPDCVFKWITTGLVDFNIGGFLTLFKKSRIIVSEAMLFAELQLITTLEDDFSTKDVEFSNSTEPTVV